MARSLKKKNYDPRVSFVTVNQKLQYGPRLSNALAAWFEFSGGVIAYDSSGNGRNGEATGVTPSSDTPYTSTLYAESGLFGTGNSIAFSSSAGLSGIYEQNLFTFSFWVKFESISGTQRLLQLGSVSQGVRFENVNGNLVITDTAWATTGGANTYNSFFTTDTWTHVVVKFDRSTAGYATTVVKNNSTVSANSTTPSAGTRRNFTGDSYLGQSGAGSQYLLARLDSFTIWTLLFNDADIAAVYNSTAGVHELQGGIISNPARILLQERDSRTGSYPTITRTGDPDFTGIYRSFYDDTDTINFVGDSQTLYPSVLPTVSKWVSGGVATPNILQGLTASATASKGVSDSHVSFTPGENLSPFNESRVYIDNDATFYQTGTEKSILPGFDQRLGSKTIISFDINPRTATDIFFSTGTAGATNSTSAIGSGLAYYNWDLKKWEMIGDTVGVVRTGSNVDILNPNPSIRSAAPHPAGGISQFGMSAPVSNTARHVGIFHSTHGFPFATQYNSTGSQEFSLTGTLAAPFLLEKATLEWSGSFASYPIATLEDGPLNYQFMLLNISPVDDSVTIVQDLTGSASGTPGTFTTRNNSFTVTSLKDLIWTGAVARYYSGLTASAPPLTYERDLNLVKMSSDGAGLGAVTGTFRVESAAGIYGKNDGLHTLALRGDTANVPLLSNKIGFRNFGGYVEGKSFVSPIPGINPSGSFTVDGNDASKKYTISFIPSSDVRKNSPYILLPHHKLVLGFYGVPIQGTEADSGIWSEYAMRNHVTTLSPGLGRLTLYGSSIGNGVPVNYESNQPLTSHAIHEDLRYDSPICDQFDVEPFETFKNSYIDVIVTGSMLATPVGNPTAANVRKVQASVTAGQAGTTGSLQRFVNLTSESDAMYDSYVPNPVDIVITNGASLSTISSEKKIVFSDVSVAALSGEDSTWWRSFPFEGKYSNIERRQSTSILGKDNDGSGLPFTGFVITGSAGVCNELGTGPAAGLTIASFNEGIKSFFGFPRSLAPAALTQGGLSSEARIAGFRYGLAGLFGTYTASRFRRDRYGQFRDMLEGSPNAAYLVANSVEYPVNVNFFSRPGKDGKGRLPTVPTQTHSQNLDPHFTSSLPYFDGVARERSDDPDVSLIPVNISVILR